MIDLLEYVFSFRFSVFGKKHLLKTENRKLKTRVQ